MLYLSNFPRLNTVIILLFFWAWLYTEIEEKQASAEWKAFIHAGKRFTAEDGDELRRRIEELEATCEANSAGWPY
jgi:hypothetical protein